MRNALWVACLVLVCAEVSAATMEDAARDFDAKRWAEAAATYQEIAAREPANALALIRLARSRAANGEAAEALTAL